MSERSEPPRRSAVDRAGTGLARSAAARETATWTSADVEAVLGAPLPSDDADPKLTTAQAAALLRITVNRLHYLRRNGRAIPSGRRWRRWRLSDLAKVQHEPPPRETPADPVHAGRVPTEDAAAALGVSRRTFHRWAATAQAPTVRDSRGSWWVRPEDLEAIRGRVLGPDPVHAGRVPSAEAAAILGLAPGAYRAAATAGRVPAIKDRDGRWWARPEHLEMIRRARDVEESRQINPPAASS